MDSLLRDFEKKHEACLKEIQILQNKWEIAVGEIWKVGVKCLGEKVMSTLLLRKPPSLSLSPLQNVSDTLTIEELEPKPARKKVKFQRPQPKAELPEFLYRKSVCSDLPSPEQVSTKDIKKLEGMVDVCGTTQVKALVKIEKESKQSWVKKMQGVLDSLEDE